MPVASALVLSRASPAAGPSAVIGVFDVMRRLSLPSPRTRQSSPSRSISTMVTPWAAISISTSSAVISSKPEVSWRFFSPGNISSSLVYS